MTQSPQRQAPTAYRIQVAGHLDRYWSPWFGDFDVTHEDDGTTSLSGEVADQSELHGLLTRIRDLGVSLISVAVIDPPHRIDHQPCAPDTPEVLGESRGE